MEILYIIISFLILSISINVAVFLVYIKKRGINHLAKNLSTKNSHSNIYKKFLIPEIYTKNSLQLSFKNNVQNKNSFLPWKNKLITKFQELHDLPNFQDLQVNSLNIINSEKKLNYNVTKLSTIAQDGDTIILYELIPKKINKNTSAVFIVPGSGNQGAKDVINMNSEISDNYYQQGIAEQIVNEGYIVYVIENRGWGERKIDVGSICDQSDIFCSGEFLERQIKNLGFDLINLQIIDTLQTIKSLESNKKITFNNLFLLGITHGGKIALRSSLFLPELKGLLLSSSLFSTENFGTFGNGYNHGFLKYFDNPDLVITLAPKPLYLAWGQNENPPQRYEAQSLHTFTLVKNAYRLLNSEKNIVGIVHDQKINSGHTVDPQSVINFLKNYSNLPNSN